MKFLIILATAIAFYGIAGALFWLMAQAIGIGPAVLIALAAVSFFVSILIHEVNSATHYND